MTDREHYANLTESEYLKALRWPILNVRTLWDIVFCIRDRRRMKRRKK